MEPAIGERGSRFRDAARRLGLLANVRCSGLETAVVAVYVFALAFGVYGVYVVRGSFTFDDWTLAYDVRHALDAHGFFGAVNNMLTGNVLTGNVDGRPIEAVHLVAQYGLLGEHVALHIGSAVALAALASFLFYVVLRWIGVERLHAGSMATLVLLFPAADSTVFFLTADVAHVTMVLYLVGTICALRGLRARGHTAVVLHALAVVLYAASILEYQIAAPFILLSVFVYRFAGATWRMSIARWGVDAVVTLISLVYVKNHLNRETGSFSHDLDQARNLAGGARHLLASLGILNGPELLPAIVMVVLLLVTASVARLLPRADAVRDQLRRWLLIAAVGLVTIGAAYSIFIPADFFYWPLRPGIGNRVNAAAAFGYAIVIYSVAVLISLLVVRALRIKDARAAAAGIAFAATLALAASYVSTLNSHRQPYERSATLQRQALAVLENDVPRPSPGTIVYLFGVEGEVAPLVFSFVRWQDLTAALRLLWNDDTVVGVPASSTAPEWSGNTKTNSGISCGRDSLKPNGWLFDDFPPSSYDKVLFVDVPTRTHMLIRTRGDCEAAVERFRTPA